MVGLRLKQARIKRGLTQQQLGDLINVSKVSISGYEAETRQPTLEKFMNLIDVLELSPDYLFGRDVRAISEFNEPYSIRMSKEELNMMKEIKKNKKLYSKLITEPVRTIELIDRKIN